MPKVKRMNESAFVNMQKEMTVIGDLIRSRQEEKQGVLNEFDAESKRFFFGKISEASLRSSIKKTNKELKRLDSDIRKAMQRAREISGREMKLVSSQAPVGYRATLSGIKQPGKKKKPAKKKAVKKKKVVKKKTVNKATKKKPKKKAVKKKAVKKASKKKSSSKKK